MRLLAISVRAYAASKRVGHDDHECLVTAVHSFLLIMPITRPYLQRTLRNYL